MMIRKIKCLKSFRFGALMLLAILFGCDEKKEVKLMSPDGTIQFHLEMNDSNIPEYNVNWNLNPILGNSALGFQLLDSSFVLHDVKIENIETLSVDTTWAPVYGEQDLYADRYNEILLHLFDRNPRVGKMALRIRAYNEGVAFRYEFDTKDTLFVRSELTEFGFKTEPSVWVSSRAQSPIMKARLSDVKDVCERPLLAELNDSVYVSLGEAALVDFARMKFTSSKSKPNTLLAHLETGTGAKDENGKKYPVFIPAQKYETPWRMVMIGKSPATILQNNFMILNLNKPNQIADVSWIKPGKVIREVSLTTQGGKACVEFAVKHNLQYIEFDAGWYGSEYDDASDATTVTVDPNRSPGPLNLQEVIEYGKQKNIGVILYINRRAMEKQLDEVLPLYKSWGAAGLKYGFVNVGTQYWTKWLHEAIRKAADNQLMLDIHDEYRPTGYSRTYPNLLTQEGIRGDEESTPNDMLINTIFTRMVAGAGDQTNCYFAERVTGKMGSHASQMAKAICIYSPWQFLYWYDRPVGSPNKGGAGGVIAAIPEIPDLEFYDRLPTVWNQTKVIDGYPGKLALIARKNADSWYLGAITGTEEYEMKLKLDFLEEGVNYEASVFSDDAALKSITNLKIEKLAVTKDSVLKYKILKQNGLAVIISPLK